MLYLPRTMTEREWVSVTRYTETDRLAHVARATSSTEHREFRSRTFYDNDINNFQRLPIITGVGINTMAPKKSTKTSDSINAKLALTIKVRFKRHAMAEDSI